MKELRHLTRDKKNLTNELDFEFSTEIMENVLNVPDDQNEAITNYPSLFSANEVWS